MPKKVACIYRDMFSALTVDIGEAGIATNTMNELMDTAIGGQKRFQASMKNTQVVIGGQFIPGVQDLRGEIDATTRAAYAMAVKELAIPSDFKELMKKR